MLNFQSESTVETENLSVFDLDNIRDILASPVEYDWFSAVMLRTCQKADRKNMMKIAQVFPDIASAFLIFHTGFIPEVFHTVIPDWEIYEKMMTPHIRTNKNGY